MRSSTAYRATLLTSRVKGATLTLRAARSSSLAVVVTKRPGGGTLAV